METTRALIHDVYLDYCQAKDRLYKTCIDTIEAELFRKASTLWVTDEAQATFKTDVRRVYHQKDYPYSLMYERDNKAGANSILFMPIEDLTAIAMILIKYELKLHRNYGNNKV